MEDFHGRRVGEMNWFSNTGCSRSPWQVMVKPFALVQLVSPSRGHKVEQQREFRVFYEDQHIGTLIPDLIVDDLVIVDPKVATAFHPTHLAQMLGYLNIIALRLALLLNL